MAEATLAETQPYDLDRLRTVGRVFGPYQSGWKMVMMEEEQEEVGAVMWQGRGRLRNSNSSRLHVI